METGTWFLKLPVEIRDNILSLLPNQSDVLSLMTCNRATFEAFYKFLWCEPEFHRYSALQKFIASITQPDNGKHSPIRKHKGRYVREVSMSALSRHEKRSLVKDSDIISILGACPNLASLRLASCEQLSSATFRAVRLLCNKLHEIDFSNIQNIDDELLCDIVKANPLIEHIELANCNSLSADCICQIATQCGHRLQTLDLLLCQGLTDAALFSITAMAPNIRQINVGGCSLLTDRGVCSLVAQCPKLEILILRGLTSISNLSLDAIAQNSLHLKVLDLSQTDRITVSGVRRVFAQCALEEIDYRYAFNLITGLKQWLHECPTISVVNGKFIDDFLETDEVSTPSRPFTAFHRQTAITFPTDRLPWPSNFELVNSCSTAVSAEPGCHPNRQVAAPSTRLLHVSKALCASAAATVTGNSRPSTPSRRPTNGTLALAPSGYLGTSPAAGFLSVHSVNALKLQSYCNASETASEVEKDSNGMILDEPAAAYSAARKRSFLEPDVVGTETNFLTNRQLSSHFSSSLKLYELTNPLSALEVEDSLSAPFEISCSQLTVDSPSSSRPSSPSRHRSREQRIAQTDVVTPTRKRAAKRPLQRYVPDDSMDAKGDHIEDQENLEIASVPATNTRSKILVKKKGSLTRLRRHSTRTCGKRLLQSK